MGDQIARAEEFEKKAEKKLNGWGLFGSKYEDAADLFDKAANSFKLAKSCTLIFLFFCFLIIIVWFPVILFVSGASVGKWKENGELFYLADDCMLTRLIWRIFVFFKLWKTRNFFFPFKENYIFCWRSNWRLGFDWIDQFILYHCCLEMFWSYV